MTTTAERAERTEQPEHEAEERGAFEALLLAALAGR